MTDPKPFTVAEAREMIENFRVYAERRPRSENVPLTNLEVYEFWQRILATAQQAERRWVPEDEYQHKETCAAIRPGDGECTCGLTVLLMELEGYDRE